MLLVLAALAAFAPGALAQENATDADDANESSPQGADAEGEGNATPSDVAPGGEQEQVIPPDEAGPGDATDAEFETDPNQLDEGPDVVDDRQFQDEPQEAGAAQTFLFAGLWIASSIVLAFLALLGVAYASYRRGGAHR